MEKFITRFGLFCLAPSFPWLFVFIPPLLIAALAFILLGGVALLHGVIVSLFRPRR